jgi:hypothetical protein
MPSLAPFGQAVSEEKIFLTLVNQKKKLFLVAMFIGICYMSQHVLYCKYRRRHFYVICHKMHYIVSNGEDISKLNAINTGPHPSVFVLALVFFWISITL